MKVEILTHTQNPELTIAAAAKLCYSKSSISDLMQQTPEQVEKFLTMLMSLGHESPVEHVSFTFGIEGVSRILEQQLTRHRIASYSIQSGRYVDRTTPNFYMPKEIEKNEEAKQVYIETMLNSTKAYCSITSALLTQYFDEWKQKNKINVSFEDFKGLYKTEYSKINKKAIENARYAFPQSLETKIVCTMNFRTLINFTRHRCCKRAQDEIQDLSWKIVEEVSKISPLLAKYLGAPCQFDKCPEGKMTCGKPIK